MTFRDSKDAARKWRTPESLWRMPGSRGRSGARAGWCGQGRARTASSPSASYRGSASAGNSWTCGPRARHLPSGSQRAELRFARSFQPKVPTLRRLAWGYRRNSWRLFVSLFNQQRLERTCRTKNAPCLQYANESSVESFAGQQQGEHTQLSSVNPSFRAKWHLKRPSAHSILLAYLQRDRGRPVDMARMAGAWVAWDAEAKNSLEGATKRSAARQAIFSGCCSTAALSEKMISPKWSNGNFAQPHGNHDRRKARINVAGRHFVGPR